jgi:hypothetical protein
MRKLKFFLIVLISIVVTILSIFPLAGIVYALCNGTACNNTDPQSTGCSASAATVRTKYPASGLARVELRFSDACQTRWARTYNISSLNYYANATLRYWYYKALYIAPGINVYSNQRYGSGYQGCGDVAGSPMNYLINDSARCTTSY